MPSAVSLVFGSDALHGATLVPRVSTIGRIGLRAGTSEHMRDVIATRIAIDHGYMSDRLIPSLLAAGGTHEAEGFGRLAARQPLLQDRLSGSPQRSVDRIRSLLLTPFMQSPPIEAHLRQPAPRQLIALHAEAANVGPRVVWRGARDSAPAVYQRKVRGLLDAEVAANIIVAARRRDIPALNVDEHLRLDRSARAWDGTRAWRGPGRMTRPRA